MKPGWKSLVVLMLISSFGCTRSVPRVQQKPPPVQMPKGGPCGRELGPSPFQNPTATHFLVADFHGVPLTGSEAEFSETVSRQMLRALETFKEETLRNPKEFGSEVPEDALEIRRLTCFVESHEQAEAAARELGADVVIWGQAFANAVPPVVVNNSSKTSVGDISVGQNSVVQIGTTEVHAGKPYTVSPRATLHRWYKSYRRGGERGVDLASLGHLTLPKLRSTELFLLIQFALGLHFYEQENYALAARFFERSAGSMLPKERDAADLELALGVTYLFLGDLERSIRYSSEGLKSVKGSGREIEGALLNSIGCALFAQGNYAEALDHLRQAQVIGEKVLGEQHLSMASNLTNIGRVLLAQGEYTEAVKAFRRSLAITEQELGGQAPEVANCLASLGNALYEVKDYADALKQYQRALMIDEKALGKEHPAIVGRLNGVSSVMLANSDYSGALEYARRALALGGGWANPTNPEVAVSLDIIAHVLYRKGDHAGAMEHIRHALELKEKTSGKNNPEVALYLNIIGDMLKWQKDYIGALKQYRAALAIMGKVKSKDPLPVTDSLSRIGNLLAAQGDIAGALKCFRQAVGIIEKALGTQHPSLIDILNDMGLALHLLGEREREQECFQRAQAIAEKVFGRDSPGLVKYYIGIAGAGMSNSNATVAVRYFQLATEIEKRTLGQEHPDVLIDMSNLGLALAIQGDLPKSREVLESALSIAEKALGKDDEVTQAILRNLATVSR